MPEITYPEKEIKKRVIPKKPVNKSGNVYVGRDCEGCDVEVIVLK